MTVRTTYGSNSYQALLKSISGIDLGDYAIRGMSATLTPISGGEDSLPRAIDGTLLDWTVPQFRKYAVTISCSDLDAPDLTGVWQGQLITVEFEPGLGVLTAGSTATDGTESLVINCMLDSWNVTRDDFGDETGWQLNLLEI